MLSSLEILGKQVEAYSRKQAINKRMRLVRFGLILICIVFGIALFLKNIY